MVSYAVQLATRYDGLVIATFPDLPGVNALGRDDEEALHEAEKALSAALEEYEREGTDLPSPRAPGLSRVSVELIARPMPA